MTTQESKARQKEPAKSVIAESPEGCEALSSKRKVARRCAEWTMIVGVAIVSLGWSVMPWFYGLALGFGTIVGGATVFSWFDKWIAKKERSE